MTVAPAPPGLPVGRALTWADLEGMPEDGHRYELIDGSLIVTPAPARRHQRGVGGIYTVLRSACPPDLEVLLAPFDVVIADDTVVQPDVLVANRSASTERALHGAPLLAVEVLSPSTRRIDLMLKRSRYEAAGCLSYWVLDPEDVSLTAWQLVEGSYQLAGEVGGDASLALTQPFPVTVCPGQILQG